jgi:hypothetical protein
MIVSRADSLRTVVIRDSTRDGRPEGGVVKTSVPRAPALLPRPRVPSAEDAANRVSAYVYGNVLVMATLISLRPEDLRGPTGVLSVLGVGLSTVVAHLVGHGAGHRIRHGRSIRWPDVRREIRDTVPIGMAATVPSAFLVPAWAGWVDPRLSLALALGVSGLRLALLGSAVEWFSGERSSARLFLAGAGLAAAAATAAALKWLLTH